jgi:hypothetical protein
MTRVREPVRYKEAQENMQRIRFVLLVLVAAMLGALISMVDSSPGWDDTGVSAAMVLGASGLMGALHPQRAWVWALAVGSWIPALGSQNPSGLRTNPARTTLPTRRGRAC